MDAQYLNLNPAALKRLKQLAANTPAIATGLANIDNDVRLHCDAVLRALEIPEGDAANSLLHALAGMSASIGAVTLSQYSRGLMKDTTTPVSTKQSMLEQIRDKTLAEIRLLLEE